MQKQNEKIGIRISQEQKKAALKLVESGRFRSLSQVVRTALVRLFEDKEVEWSASK